MVWLQDIPNVVESDEPEPKLQVSFTSSVNVGQAS
jgi:hypothetical protein